MHSEALKAVVSNSQVAIKLTPPPKGIDKVVLHCYFCELLSGQISLVNSRAISEGRFVAYIDEYDNTVAHATCNPHDARRVLGKL